VGFGRPLAALSALATGIVAHAGIGGCLLPLLVVATAVTLVTSCSDPGSSPLSSIAQDAGWQPCPDDDGLACPLSTDCQQGSDLGTCSPGECSVCVVGSTIVFGTPQYDPPVIKVGSAAHVRVTIPILAGELRSVPVSQHILGDGACSDRVVETDSWQKTQLATADFGDATPANPVVLEEHTVKCLRPGTWGVAFGVRYINQFHQAAVACVADSSGVCEP
jgi:hypothetical protein